MGSRLFFGNGEQGTGNRKQGTGNREQETGNGIRYWVVEKSGTFRTLSWG